jgi:hypothetical protein
MARTRTQLKACPATKRKRGEQVVTAYYVIYNGVHVGYKPVGYGSPLQFITRRITEEEKQEIADDVEYILGDISKIGEVVGIWESEEETEELNGGLDDIFN